MESTPATVLVFIYGLLGLTNYSVDMEYLAILFCSWGAKKLSESS